MSRRRFQAVVTTSLVIIDAAMVALAFILGYHLRRAIPWPADPVNIEPLPRYIPLLLVQVLSVLVVFFFYKLYHQLRVPSRVDLFYNIFGGVSIGTMLSVAIAALTFKNSIFELDYPRVMIVYAWLFAILFVTLGRLAHQRILAGLHRRGWGQDRVLIVGTGEVGQMLLQKIRWSPHLGYRVVGFADGSGGPQEVLGTPVLGTMDELPRLIDQHHIDEVIIALPEASHREIVRLISMCERGKVNIKIFPDVFQIMASQVTIGDLGGLPLLTVRDIALRGWRLSLKRAMDIVVSAIALVLLSPLMLLTALLIKLESEGPVFYVQERMGMDAKPFMMLKFRSMRSDAESNGPGWTVANDPRRTRLGKILRSLSVDELPQLINVLIGDMSLVGPRPERPVYVEEFRQSIPRYMDRHREKAGITGWAQVNGLRGDTSITERTKYDLWYVENWSLWLDIKILIRTIFQIFSDRRNAY